MRENKSKTFAAVKKWKKDEGESVEEYFETIEEALKWIKKQPKSPDYEWMVGEWE
jgi:hypothetical protein